MSLLPPDIALQYRPATDRQVRSWSFGRVTVPRQPRADGWEWRRGTLDDPAIFGTEKDWECVCGKYRGREHQGLVCDRCGVKVASRGGRRRRFGHIELPAPIPHPFGDGQQQLAAVPVIPAAYFQSVGGWCLARTYDDLVQAAQEEDADVIDARIEALLERLLPVVRLAHEWGLQEASTLARGLALVRRAEQSDGRCENCGFPTAGLTLVHCPGCGATLAAG